MMSFNEIKKFFEHKSYLVRSEFINDYDFEDDYLTYYYNFIVRSTTIKNHLYLSDLIDLSGWLGFYDKNLQRRWMQLLVCPNHFVVRLAVLDYFKHCSIEQLPSNYERRLAELLDVRLQKIVRMQILFNLIYQGKRNRDIYLLKIRKLFKSCTDSRIYMRMLNNLRHLPVESKDRAILCEILKQSSLGKRLPQEVLHILDEVCRS